MIKLLVDHLFVSILIGSFFSIFFGNYWLLLVALLTGWLIDGDHLVDFLYFLITSADLKATHIANIGGNSSSVASLVLKLGSKLNLNIFSSGAYFQVNQKVFVPLHSWELVFGWLIFWFLFIGNLPVALTGAFSWGIHLLKDQRDYKVVRFGYFFIYRLSRSFDLKGFCRS